jgi:hypothetical protein
MGRSVVVHILLGTVLVCGCRTAPPDPALLELKPEAFANPQPRDGEASNAKDTAHMNVVADCMMPGVKIAAKVALLAGLGALAVLGHGHLSGLELSEEFWKA